MGQAAFHRVLAQSRVDGPTLTAAAAATMLHARDKITLPNGYFREGRQLRVTASGRISCVVTTPGTARFDVRVGAILAFDSLAMNLNIVAKVNVHWLLEVLLTCRTIGSGVASNLMGQGRFTSEAVIGSPLPTVGGSGVLAIPVNTAPVVGANFDNQLQNTLDVFFTQTVATGSLTCHQYLVEELDAGD